jgi:hypothetical protein
MKGSVSQMKKNAAQTRLDQVKESISTLKDRAFEIQMKAGRERGKGYSRSVGHH